MKGGGCAYCCTSGFGALRYRAQGRTSNRRIGEAGVTDEIGY
ncbi:hypothetical protein ACFOET_01935 [Parapedobacter deserti]|uniref:Uncharacterized protein n=1 Tax=Parapedobacter deserti TaxID=1912957 RepID=A0ABV7JHM6_9SPHI